jgi:predicted MPP superfamily phosphohydrolase
MSGPLFLAVRFGSTAFDVLVAVTVLQRLSRAGGVAAPLVGALAAAGSAFLIKLVPWSVLGLGVFGVIHLAYLDLIAVPSVLVVAGFALARRRGAAWARGPVAGLSMGLAASATPLVGAYASFVEPFDLRFEVTRIPVTPERQPVEPLRIGVLADIQTARVTAHEHRAIDALMAERPDIIVLPGDLFHGAAETFGARLGGLRALMAKLRAPGGVYFALGDTDTDEELAAIFAGSEVRLLVNEVNRVVIKGRAVTIAGVELDSRRPAAAALFRALEQAPGEDVRILVSHRPDAVLRLPPRTRIDQVVAGHTHGGQVQLPLLGPPIILSQVPRAVGAGGYHVIDGRAIYVSRGVGHEGGQAPRIRFLCPPEVSLLLLGRQDP